MSDLYESETSRLLVDLTARLKAADAENRNLRFTGIVQADELARRDAQIAALTTVAEAAKALLRELTNGSSKTLELDAVMRLHVAIANLTPATPSPPPTHGG